MLIIHFSEIKNLIALKGIEPFCMANDYLAANPLAVQLEW
jgi:hypothetical protein